MDKFEYIKPYPWFSPSLEIQKEYPYISRFGDSTSDNDFIIFFETEREMIAFDWCDSPTLNYKDLISLGQSIKAKIYKQIYG